MGAQACRALVVILRVAGDDLLEVGGGGGEIVQPDGAQRTAIERVDCIAPRDHPIETVARPLELPVVEIQISELFIVADRGIVEDGGFQFPDPLSTREDLKGAAEQAGVGDDLDDNVDQRADGAAHQDDEEPIGVRPAAHEVQNRDGLQKEPVRIEQPEHAGFIRAISSTTATARPAGRPPARRPSTARWRTGF